MHTELRCGVKGLGCHPGSNFFKKLIHCAISCLPSAVSQPKEQAPSNMSDLGSLCKKLKTNRSSLT